MQSLRERTEKAMVAFNNHEIEAVLEQYDGDCVRVHPDGSEVRGIAAIRDEEQNLGSGFPDGHVDEVAIHVAGDVVVSCFTFHGTNTGEQNLPDGTPIPATGKEISLTCCTVDEYGEEGLIVRQQQYWDNLAAFSQLGLLPQ